MSPGLVLLHILLAHSSTPFAVTSVLTGQLCTDVYMGESGPIALAMKLTRNVQIYESLREEDPNSRRDSITRYFRGNSRATSEISAPTHNPYTPSSMLFIYLVSCWVFGYVHPRGHWAIGLRLPDPTSVITIYISSNGRVCWLNNLPYGLAAVSLR